jgi:hypothetical protein
MMLIFAMLIVPVSIAVGVVAVDANTWQSERRGAQKDADHSALAGALQLIFEQDQANAENAAIDYADTNDEAGNADVPVAGNDASVPNSVVVDDACFPDSDILPLNTVSVNLNHDSQSFFGEVFGINVAPDVGAHARACAGSLNEPSVGLRPFILDIETSPCFDASTGVPNFGALCVMDFGAQGSGGGANRGVADLEVPNGQCSNVPGSGDLEEIIEHGAPGGVTCSTQTGNTCPTPFVNCVVGQTGNVANKTLDGLAAMLGNEGACDGLYTSSPDTVGIDDFDEALELIAGPGGSDPSNVYATRPCDASGKISPRIITIFAVDEWLGSNDPMPIRYFVVMYVEGCRRDDGTINRTCVGNNGPPGHAQAVGRIVQAFTTSVGSVGPPNAGGAFAITLDE